MKTNESHGMSGTRVHRIWAGIKQRCRNEKNPAFIHYGGRGIDVCDRWYKSFINFYMDMGEPPTDAHSIDRIDNDCGYFPENCQWATYAQQASNRRPQKLSSGSLEAEIIGGEYIYPKDSDDAAMFNGVRQARIESGWTFAGEWISIADKRKPETGEIVLCADDNGNLWVDEYLMPHNDDDWWVIPCFWQPFPPPPAQKYAYRIAKKEGLVKP